MLQQIIEFVQMYPLFGIFVYAAFGVLTLAISVYYDENYDENNDEDWAFYFFIFLGWPIALFVLIASLPNWLAKQFNEDFKKKMTNIENTNNDTKISQISRERITIQR